MSKFFFLILIQLAIQQCFVDVNSIVTFEKTNTSLIITLSKRYNSDFPSFKFNGVYFYVNKNRRLSILNDTFHKNISLYRNYNVIEDIWWLTGRIIFEFNGTIPSNITFVYLEDNMLHTRIITKYMSYNCDKRLGIFAMITSITVWTYSIKQIFYFSMLVLAVVYRNYEPIKSRSITLILCMIFHLIYGFGDYLESTMNYETYSQIGCYIDYYLLYLPQQYTYIIIVFSLVRYILMVNINAKKNAHEFENSQVYRFIKLGLGKPVFIIFTVSYAFFFAVVGIFVLWLNSFQCYTFTITLSSLVVLVFCAFCAGCFFLIVLFDILSNVKNFFSRKGLKIYFFTLDPFRFRTEHSLVLLLVIVFVLWALIPIIEFKVFMVELAFFIAFLVDGGISLIITIYRQHTKVKVEESQLIEILKDKNMCEEFVHFMKSEWSIENYLLYDDLQKYYKSDKDERKKLGKDILDVYLLSSSIYEVNIKAESRTKAIHEINNEGDLSFLEKEVINNMKDTMSRFVFHPKYIEYDKLKKSGELAKKLVQ